MSRPLRVVLFGEESAGLQAAKLIAESGATLVGIGTTLAHEGRATPLAAFAAQQQVPAWPPAVIRLPAFAETLLSLDVDLLLNVHSLVLLPDAVLRAPALGAFNLHPGPLPQYAGLSCPSWAILHGATTYGVTLHRMVPEVDAGDIAFAAEVAVPPRATGVALSVACIRAGLPLVRQLLDAALQSPTAIPRHSQGDGDRHVYPRRIPGGCRIDWQVPAVQIDRLVRAADYAPFPSPWGPPLTSLGPDQIGVLKAEATSIEADAMPGEVGLVEGDAVLVAAADCWVRLHRLLHGGAPRSAASVLRPGQRLGAAISGRVER